MFSEDLSGRKAVFKRDLKRTEGYHMGGSELEKYLEENRERHLEELKDFLRIPSISALEENAGDMLNAAQWLEKHLAAAGMENVEVIEGEGHPMVYAQWLHAPNRPTMLVYGHYDVQPVDPLERWESPPFEPTVRKGNDGEDLYARGSSDDKGQLFAIIKAVEALIKTREKIPVNIKFLVEGEEEVGSRSIIEYTRQNQGSLDADVTLISDTAILSPKQPCITYGLRGIWAGELIVRGPDTDLHSGLYGGVIHNPVQALAEIISSMHDDRGRVIIEGFHDDVRDIPVPERKMLSQVPYGEKEIKQESGVGELYGDPVYTPLERIGAQPTLEINGIRGGFSGTGFKTVIPAEASAKISCRLVPEQDPEHIGRLLRKHIDRVTPPTVTAELKPFAGMKAALVDPELPEIQAAVRAYKRSFGTEPVFTLSGGGIPVATLFLEELDSPVILMGFGLPDDNLHAPNEKIHIPNFYRGIRAAVYFMEELRDI